MKSIVVTSCIIVFLTFLAYSYAQTCPSAVPPRAPSTTFNDSICRNGTDKVVVITGISSLKGNGRATALFYAARGWTVFGCARTHKNKVANFSQLEDAGIHYDECDVRSENSIRQYRRKLERTLSDLGLPRTVHVLVSNAGKGTFGNAVDYTPDQLLDIYLTNTRGPQILFQEFRELIPTDGTGKFAVVTSLGGYVAVPYQNVYLSSKWGLAGWVFNMQQDMQTSNIDIIEISPTTVNTNYMDNVIRAAECDLHCQEAVDTAFNRTVQLLAVAQPSSNVAAAIYQATCQNTRATVWHWAVAGEGADYGGYVALATNTFTRPRKEAVGFLTNAIFCSGAGESCPLHCDWSDAPNTCGL